VAIDRPAHTVTTRSTETAEESIVPSDKLILSMGAAPVRPPIPGYDRVRTLRTVEDAASVAADVEVDPETAVVIGAGFIGLEMAENLVAQGLAGLRISAGFDRGEQRPVGLPGVEQ
jgi:NADPH-dependent 2,4-dienoyl-CoA reductase/sulfur reductase-like enzyme